MITRFHDGSCFAKDQYNANLEQVVGAVENFAANARIGTDMARSHMRNAVNGLIRLRRGGDAVDEVLELLVKLKTILDNDELFASDNSRSGDAV